MLPMDAQVDMLPLDEPLSPGGKGVIEQDDEEKGPLMSVHIGLSFDLCEKSQIVRNSVHNKLPEGSEKVWRDYILLYNVYASKGKCIAGK